MKSTLSKTTANTTLSLAFAAWVLLTSSPCFAGTVLVGGFEGSFGSWSTTGLATIEGTFGGVVPPQGASQALIRSSDDDGDDVAVADLATFLGIPQAQIDALGTGATRGSGLSLAITGVNVGDKLTFSWNFLTSETAPSTRDDFGFFSISHTADPQTATLLADIGDASNPFSSPEGYFSMQTGYGPMSHTFDTAGNYTIGFGVVNVDSTSFSSGLLIDEVSLTAVPEPTALAGLGLVGLALSMRRRRR